MGALAEHVGGGDDRDAVARRREAVRRRAGDERHAVGAAGPLAGAGERGRRCRARASTPNSRSARLCESHAIATRRPSPRQRAERGDQRRDVLGVAERARVIELLAEHAEVVDLDAQP